jgi:hypothetical protein
MPFFLICVNYEQRQTWNSRYLDYNRCRIRYVLWARCDIGQMKVESCFYYAWLGFSREAHEVLHEIPAVFPEKITKYKLIILNN